jgi:hypothetical protein
MFEPSDYSSYEFLRPLVKGWEGKIELALQSPGYKRWKEISDECLMFYAKSAAAMWDPQYTQKFWSNIQAPRFRITINKAFEFVAIFGPNLLWDTPHRAVKPKQSLVIPQELFASQPGGEQMYQALMQASSQDKAADQAIAFLMEGWLNYTARETPGGGVAGQSELCVIDSLIKGRGVLWPAVHKFPASGRSIIGSFHDQPENLLIDPDFNSLNKAKWVARRHVQAHWEVERRFGLPANSLMNKAATLESSWSYGEWHGNDDKGNPHRSAGKTNDLVVWYEIFSKTGIGTKLTGMEEGLKKSLGDLVGDFAYLAISPNVPYPLNCSKDFMLSGAIAAEVRHRFEWPTPFWADDRWPFEVVDYYPDPESAYPVPPLAPAMGELKLLNFLVPWAINRVHSSSRDFWAIAGPYVDQLEKYIKNGGDQSIIPWPSQVDDIRKVITILQQPETRLDLWKIIDMVSILFDKRTGLTEQAYGRNEDGTQNRTAEETIAKKQAIGVRSEHMQKRVVDWQSRIASSEAFLSRLFINGEDVEPLFGPAGRFLWEQHVMQTDVPRVSRQMEFTVAAASIRRPNRDRDIANYQTVMQYFIPVMQTYGETTGNFGPFNFLMSKWAEYHDADMEGAMIPEPTEEEQASKQQQQQQAAAQMDAEIQKVQADAQLKIAQAQAAGNDEQAAQLQMVLSQMELGLKQQEGQMDMAKTQAELIAKGKEIAMNMQAKRVEMAMDLRKQQQQMLFDREAHQQEMQQQAQQGKQQLQLNKQMATAKAKAAAKAKPAPARK